MANKPRIDYALRWDPDINQMYIVHHACGMKSYSEGDIDHRYCEYCHVYIESYGRK